MMHKARVVSKFSWYTARASRKYTYEMGSFLSRFADLFRQKLEVCIVGLDNSGKSTLVNQISVGQAGETIPTIGMEVKVVRLGKLILKMIDLGGQDRYRNTWKTYTEGCNVLIFMVDSFDVARIAEAKKELHSLLELTTLTGVPILILVNKIDKNPRLTHQQVVAELSLDYITETEWAVVECSALLGQNLDQVLEWLVTQSKRRKRGW